jgi:hypothetical protein
MADPTISRVRMPDLARLGRARTGHGQLVPRTGDLVGSSIR